MKAPLGSLIRDIIIYHTGQCLKLIKIGYMIDLILSKAHIGLFKVL